MKKSRIEIAPGIFFWPEYFDGAQQKALLRDILQRVESAPFYRPSMPKTGAPLSVEMTNFGPLGWVSDRSGYRYQPAHPVTGRPWPEFPPRLLALWTDLTGYPARPEACLVNLYRHGARMGTHRDEDEKALDAPVLSVSLGDTALFRIGGLTRGSPTRLLALASGDVLLFGGAARLAYHGVGRIKPGTSQLVPDGGRINLTLRRVSMVNRQNSDKETASQGV